MFNVEKLVKEGLEILIYSGMEDFICNYMTSEMWMRKLKWPLASGWQQAEEVEWRVNGTVAGYYKKYRNLHLLKIKNAGHLVPMDQPFNALTMIMRFIYLENETYYLTI